MQCPILAVGREKEGREGGRLDDGAQGALFFAAPTAEYLCIWRREERGRRKRRSGHYLQGDTKGKGASSPFLPHLIAEKEEDRAG